MALHPPKSHPNQAQLGALRAERRAVSSRLPYRIRCPAYIDNVKLKHSTFRLSFVYGRDGQGRLQRRILEIPKYVATRETTRCVTAKSSTMMSSCLCSKESRTSPCPQERPWLKHRYPVRRQNQSLWSWQQSDGNSAQRRRPSRLDPGSSFFPADYDRNNQSTITYII
jgi:hypothetical protein